MNRAMPLLLAVLGACAVASVPYDYSSEPDPRRSEYVIGVADRLSIQVWKNPELSTDATVRPDGTITMPLIGDIEANGHTPSQLKKEIMVQLAKFVRTDGIVVTVGVTGVNSYSIVVSGNVQHPGVFTSQKYVTVLEAVQLAGGPSRFANPRETKLLRRDRAGKIREIPIDYPAVVAGKRPEANLALMAGDQVYVP